MDQAGLATDESNGFRRRETSWQRRVCSLAGASALIVLLAVALHLQSRHHMQRVPASLHDGLLAQATAGQNGWPRKP